MNALQKLRQMVGEVREPKNPMQILPSWQLVERLLQRMPVDAAEATRVCAARDVAGLDALVARLENPAAPKPAGNTADAASPTSPASQPTKDELHKALRAFRKRLKVMRLADESRLSGRLLTKGQESEIDAIQPPHEFADEVWRTLAREGRLTHTGQGFYSLPETK